MISQTVAAAIWEIRGSVLWDLFLAHAVEDSNLVFGEWMNKHMLVSEGQAIDRCMDVCFTTSFCDVERTLVFNHIKACHHMLFESQHKLTKSWWSTAPAVFPHNGTGRCAALQLHSSLPKQSWSYGSAQQCIKRSPVQQSCFHLMGRQWVTGGQQYPFCYHFIYTKLECLVGVLLRVLVYSY